MAAVIRLVLLTIVLLAFAAWRLRRLKLAGSVD